MTCYSTQSSSESCVPLPTGLICSLPVPRSSSQRWEGEIHLTQRSQALPAGVHFFLAHRVIEEAKSFCCLCKCMCVHGCVYPHQLTMKEYCSHDHILLFNPDIKNTVKENFCEDIRKVTFLKARLCPQLSNRTHSLPCRWVWPWFLGL